MAPAMPCKTSKKCKHGETRGKTNEFKSKLACILEASESTRLRMGESLPNYHEDHIAGKGVIHCSTTIWYTNLFLCVFGSHTFVPISWTCKKQTSVSHSSTESEIISLDAGLRLDVFPHLIYGI